jgi:hypothetical protein
MNWASKVKANALIGFQGDGLARGGSSGKIIATAKAKEATTLESNKSQGE